MHHEGLRKAPDPPQMGSAHYETRFFGAKAVGGLKGYRRRISALGVLLFGAASTSCEGDAKNVAEERTFLVDSAGVQLVVTNSLEWEGVRHWSGEPLTVMPSPSGPVPALSLVWAADVLPDERVLVLDRLGNKIFLFDSAGILLDSIGRPGEGPGEFIAPVTMHVTSAGRVQVFDRTMRRFTEFALDGSVERILTLGRSDFPSYVAYAWLLDGDRVLAWEHDEGRRELTARTSEGERWVTPGLLRLTELGTGLADTLYHAIARDWIVQGSRSWVTPFGPSTRMSVEGEKVFVIQGDHHRIDVLDLAFGLVSSHRYPNGDRPFDLTSLEDLASAAREDANSSGVPFQAGIIFAPELQPKTQTVFEQVRVTADGDVWAKIHAPFRSHSGDWWVIDGAGRYRGVVRLPGRREILSLAGSLAVLVALDDWDVPTVEVWRIPEELR